jgi:NAD(P)H-hydrate epimerase
VLLTPHVKEFSRLSGKAVEEILSDGIELSVDFAKSFQIALLLKNASTIITDGKRVAVNVSGNSGQAKGGSGDALAGLLAGLCASGVDVFDGGCLSSFVVGKAAEFAAQRTGERGLTTMDVISYLGASFLSIEG